MAFFKAGAATGFVMGSLLLLMWHVAGRPVEQFGADGWIGSQPIIVAVAAAAWPLILAGVSGLLLGRFRPATARFYSGYAHLMPRSPREIPAAFGAGTFAAFGEEVAYRGFLIWYLSALTGTTVAVLASSLIFGIAHGYQGKTGMVFASLAGLVLAAVYLLSGSLLI